MCDYLDIFVIIFTILILFRHAKELTSNVRYIVYLLFVFLYVFPLVLDYVIGKPDYSSPKTYGFDISADDNLTKIIYDISLIYIQIILLYYHKKTDAKRLKEFSNQKSTVENDSYIYTLLIIFAFIPTFFILVLRFNTFILYTPLWREIIIDPISNFSFFDKLSYVGVLASIILLLSNTNHRYYLPIKQLAFITLYLNICIEGKRSIIFFALLCYILIKLLTNNSIKDYFQNRSGTKHKYYVLIGTIILIIVFCVWFSIFVKTTSRGYDIDNREKMYTTIRIDFFRDSRVKMEIYSLINSQNIKNADYFGKTLFESTLSLFPVDIIRGYFFKFSPLSYTAYLTATLVGSPYPSNEDSFMTPCIWSELIFNFGWLGIIITPFIFYWFIHVANNNRYPFNFFAIICFVCINMYSLGYMMYLLELVLFGFIAKKYMNRLSVTEITNDECGFSNE